MASSKAISHAITQTPDGYLWLGTEFGLFRFDGVRSIHWQPPAGQQLPDPNINTLLAARDGTLWIGTFAGLASWNGSKLTRYPELDRRFVESLLEDEMEQSGLEHCLVPPWAPLACSALSEAAAHSVTERMALSGLPFRGCMRTTRALSGSLHNLGCGDGGRVLRCGMRQHQSKSPP